MARFYIHAQISKEWLGKFVECDDRRDYQEFSCDASVSFSVMTTYLGNLLVELFLKLATLIGHGSLRVLRDRRQFLTLGLECLLDLGVDFALFVKELLHLAFHIKLFLF